MPKFEELGKDEKSLLLFVESCATDQGGRMDLRHTNTDDQDTLRAWHGEGYVKSGRIKVKDHIQTSNAVYHHWVELSDQAITDAHRCRRERIVRMLKGRGYERTDEKGEAKELVL